jgi:hypothetical protein
VRPYALKVAGVPTAVRFDRTTGQFDFVFVNRHWLPHDANRTEIFVPHYHYGASLATYGHPHPRGEATRHGRTCA